MSYVSIDLNMEHILRHMEMADMTNIEELCTYKANDGNVVAPSDSKMYQH